LGIHGSVRHFGPSEGCCRDVGRMSKPLSTTSQRQNFGSRAVHSWGARRAPERGFAMHRGHHGVAKRFRPLTRMTDVAPMQGATQPNRPLCRLPAPQTSRVITPYSAYLCSSVVVWMYIATQGYGIHRGPFAHLADDLHQTSSKQAAWRTTPWTAPITRSYRNIQPI
jgi:hypothetical protein